MKDIKIILVLPAMFLFDNYLLAQQYTIPLWNEESPNNRITDDKDFAHTVNKGITNFGHKLVTNS